MLPLRTFAGVRPTGRLRSSKLIEPTFDCDVLLVPGDPSYPHVAEHRFARVGETIEGLEVGIVSVDQGEVRWLSLEDAGEGFYLGQVDWVPNADELLVETLSRFRDRRQVLVGKDRWQSKTDTTMNEAWAVGSHGINSGADWIRSGEAFIFISEKEGWRQAYVCSRSTGPLSQN